MHQALQRLGALAEGCATESLAVVRAEAQATSCEELHV